MEASVNDKTGSGLDAMSWDAIEKAETLYGLLTDVCDRFGQHDAFSYQLLSKPNSPAETYTWGDLHHAVTQTANMFRDLGIGEEDVVGYLLPNTSETVLTLLGGMVAGRICPINPLLGVDQIVGILQSANVRVLVTLRSFPKTDIAQKASAATARTPSIRHVIEVDMLCYLKPPKAWIAGLLRPKNPVGHTASVVDFAKTVATYPGKALSFADPQQDRIVALFHTGGTTGIPKLVQHRQSGIIYNGWCSTTIGIDHESVIICPLPLFHVFAAYVVMISAMTTGAHVVFPTPAGYRGEGVFDNFWKLIEHWRVTYIITVPTALAALMQRPVDADVSSLKMALCGSAALPVELYSRFEDATGIKILEGYGLTEATCLVSANPADGVKKSGTVGFPFPHTHVRILDCAADGAIRRECAPGEVGEICVANPGVVPGATYMDPDRNHGLYADTSWLRTGDLGLFDDEGYLCITGRIKDLIIRGGHNIDPAVIEEALAGHDTIAMSGAVGQPDERLGEVPCVYVELVEGAQATPHDLLAFAEEVIDDRLATPAHVEILPVLPKTAVGKVFKPDLRKMAIKRVLATALAAIDIPATVNVDEEASRGLVATVQLANSTADREQCQELLGAYAVQWEICDA